MTLVGCSDPPTTGNFFYAEYKSDGFNGLHHTTLYVANQSLNLFMTASEFGIGLISKDCASFSCQVPTKYNQDASTTYVDHPNTS